VLRSILRECRLLDAVPVIPDLDDAIVQQGERSDAPAFLAQLAAEHRGPMAVNISAAEHNRYMTARRINERLAAFAERDGDRKQALALWQANVQLAQDWLKGAPGHPDVSKDLTVAVNQVRRLQDGKRTSR
jgi:hypothetical protein